MSQQSTGVAYGEGAVGRRLERRWVRLGDRLPAVSSIVYAESLAAVVAAEHPRRIRDGIPGQISERQFGSIVASQCRVRSTDGRLPGKGKAGGATHGNSENAPPDRRYRNDAEKLNHKQTKDH